MTNIIENAKQSIRNTGSKFQPKGSTRRIVTFLKASLLRHYNLIEVHMAAVKEPRSHLEIVVPHPKKFAIELGTKFVLNLGPILVEAFVPGSQGLGIVWSEIMNVLNNKQSFTENEIVVRIRDLSVREDPLVHPASSAKGRAVFPGDGMHQMNSIILQASIHELKVSTHVAPTAVFEKTDGIASVELPSGVSVVLKSEFTGKTLG